MKYAIFIFISALLIIYSCAEEDEGTSGYIKINTIGVTDITEKGVVFQANFDGSKIEDISNHGFVWGKGESVSTNSSFIINLGEPSSNDYSANVGYQLEAGEYYVRAFITTKENINFYGERIKFKSLGSEGPLLTNLSPTTLKLCDTLVIQGKNFIEKFAPQIKINDRLYTEFKYEPRNNRIKVLVNKILPIKNKIEVKFNDYLTSKEVSINQNQISVTMLNGLSLDPGDTIKFQLSEVPSCLISDFGTVTIEGCNNCGRQQNDFNKKQVNFILNDSCLPEELKFGVTVGDTSIFTSPSIKIQSSVINSITPLQPKLGDMITIKGNYLKSEFNDVLIKISDQNMYINTISSNEITFQLPAYLELPNDGILNGTLYTCNSVINFNLQIALPKITSISPLEISSESTEITILGENFIPGYMKINICNEFAYVSILEESQNLIKFQLLDLNDILCAESLISIITNGYVTESTQTLKFIIPSPFKQLKSFPGNARVGTANFSIGNFGYVGIGYYDNKIYNDFWMYDPISNLWTRKADFPGKTRIDPATFVIGSDAYVGLGLDENYSPVNELWKYNSISNTWTRVKDYPGAGENLSISFSINGKGYAGRASGAQPNLEFWEYNPIQNLWTRKADLPNPIHVYNYFPYFSSSTFGYYFDSNSLNKYDPVKNEWVQEIACSYPSIPGATYIVNNIAYMFSQQYSNAFALGDQTCQSILNKDYSTFFRYGVSSFLINGKGYFGIGSGNTFFWEIDFSKLE